MTLNKLVCGVLLGMSVFAAQAVAQDKPYRDGTVWSVTMIKVKPGMFDTYMREVLPQRRKIMEEAKKSGLILSEKILAGSASGREDFDVLLMTEYKNFGALDGLEAKFDVIMQKIVGSEDKQVQTMVKRGEVREIMGEKLMQELWYPK
jgi:hypothetical protein